MPHIREILPHRVKVAVAGLLCTPSLGRVVARVARDRIPSRAGGRVYTANPAISPRTKAAIFWGFYESSELRLIRSHLRRDLDVVELGASLGVTGGFASRRLDPGRRYLAVEADQRLHDTLGANIGVKVALTCKVFAVDAGPNLKEVASLRLGATTMSSHLVDDLGVPGTIEVQRCTLTELLEEEHVGEYQLLCDIEGSEAGLLSYDREAFARCRLLIIELHQSAELSVSDLVCLIQEQGFEVRAQDGPVYVFQR